MNFLGKDIPIELLRDRTRNVGTKFSSIGTCKVIGFTKDAVKMKIIDTKRPDTMNKTLYISKHTFFMSLSEEHINNMGAELPSVTLHKETKLYAG